MKWKAAKKDNNKWTIPESWLYIHYYEALTILFRFENSLRVFVFAVLKNRLLDEWTLAVIKDDETIKTLSKKRISQNKSYGYLGHEINSPIMHLTSGELISLITSNVYWKHFKEYFRGDKDIIKNKLLEVNSIRNALAHFRPIKPEDVEVTKINTNHTLMVIEPFLENLVNLRQIVPTNTKSDWYLNLSRINSDRFDIELKQSDDENWICISMIYSAKVIQNEKEFEGYHSYKVLNLISQSLLNESKQISKYITYLSENIPFVRMPEDYKPKFIKRLNLVFRKEVVIENYDTIVQGIKEVVEQVNKECKLLEKDNLARGKFVYLVRTYALYHHENQDKGWKIYYNSLVSIVKANDPTEYWGKIDYVGNFITSNTKYPWMPSQISDDELPF